MRRICSGASIAVVALLAMATPAGATPVATGCPSGFDARTVTEWVEMGYVFAPVAIDAAENGGNGDGVVCGHALPEGFTFGRFEKALGIAPHNDIIYMFGDNDSPAKQ